MSNGRLIHVFDLPQLHSLPCLQDLLDTLDQFRVTPLIFENPDALKSEQSQIDPVGAPRYLTSIISSSLSWLSSDAAREQVWEAASARLSERSGRAAAPSMTRSFVIDENLSISLYEPSLTEDNLGLKTWTSSYLLAKRLGVLRGLVPKDCRKVLELGAGTGLVGIAAAKVWDGVEVVVTDLPAIVPNLRRNVARNCQGKEDMEGRVEVRVLDWGDETDVPSTAEERFQVILAADPIYSADHPRMLVDTVDRWLAGGEDTCFIVESPLRGGYGHEREDLRVQLERKNMRLVEEGTETGFDDWQGDDDRPAEVVCWWSVWKRKQS